MLVFGYPQQSIGSSSFDCDTKGMKYFYPVFTLHSLYTVFDTLVLAIMIYQMTLSSPVDNVM